MSVIVYVESVKNQAIEAVCYAKKVAVQLGTDLCVAYHGVLEAKAVLARHGADNILPMNVQQPIQIAEALAQVAKNQEVSVVVFAQNASGKTIAPMVAAKLGAGYVSNVLSLPTDDFTVERTAFTNKAFEFKKITTPVKVLGILKNNFEIVENPAEGAVLAAVDVEVADTGIELLEETQQTGAVSIGEADVVVAGGRGLKGPENFYMIEDLAKALNGAYACSKPVSDLGWRPHSEHVGQTGKPVASQLYIAVGISGAIQHVAGINNSKVKIVINNDPEAPFFKAADYGIVGDAFEVVPALLGRLKV